MLEDDDCDEVDDAAAKSAGDPIYALWPENAEPYLLFLDLETQWRQGMGGATGLDYAAVLRHLHEGLRLPRRKIPQLYDGIRACERGALQGWAELRAEKRRD